MNNTITSLRRRVNALRDNAIGPAKNLLKLTAEQREWYALWRARCSAHAKSFDQPGDHYASILADDYVDPNPLRHDIDIALNGLPPVLTGDPKRDEVLLADRYRSLCER